MLWPDKIEIEFVRSADQHPSEPSLAVFTGPEGKTLTSKARGGSFYELCRKLLLNGAPASAMTLLKVDGKVAMVPRKLGYYAQWTVQDGPNSPISRRRWRPHEKHATYADAVLKEQLDSFWDTYNSKT